MKKLMIAAAIVCAAAMSQAAMYTWTGEGVFSGWSDVKDEYDGDYNAGGTAYLFLDSGATARDLIFAAVEAGTFEAKGYLDYADLNYKEANFAGQFGESQTPPDYEGQKMYAVILSQVAYDYEDPFGVKDTAANPYAFVTDTFTAGAEPPVGDVKIPFGDLSELTSGNGNWYAQSAVPEPTSGLLLLLGVAGLALRRRRA